MEREYGLQYFGFKNIISTGINGKSKCLDITKPLPRNFPQFDTVIAIDVLEHIAPNKRIFALEQMYKVAKKKIILSVPNGLIAYKSDQKLDKFLNKKGFLSIHLKEHIKYGVFDVEDLNKKLMKMSRTKKVEIFNGIDIKTHEKLARFLCDRNKSIFLLKNKLLFPARDLIISLSQTNTPYHKSIVIALS